MYIADIDECAEHSSGCTQSCTNTIGSYTCECYSVGFTLLSDKHTCQGKLIVSNSVTTKCFAVNMFSLNHIKGLFSI